jgi:hypothetical protein
MRRSWTIGIVLSCLLGAAVSVRAAGDHLECYRMRDSAARTRYTADLNGLAAEPGCVIKIPGQLLCVATTKTNVTPNPTGGGGTGPAGQFVCYKVKCPKGVLAPVAVSDQFGSRAVQPGTAKILCAPIATSTTTTTAPPVCGNGIVEPPESCDGAACPGVAGGGCYPPGDPAECTCCVADGNCKGPFDLLPCCDREATCIVYSPDDGVCFKETACTSPSDCPPPTTCGGPGFCCFPTGAFCGNGAPCCNGCNGSTCS